MIIKPKTLTQEEFAPFGQVLMGSGRVPERIPFAAKVENLRFNAKPNITYMRVAIVRGPVKIETLERHPHSHQMFVPLNGTRHLVAVCPSNINSDPDLTRLIVFSAEPWQAINYKAGVWHAPRSPIGGPGEFIMMRWDDGSREDEEWRSLGSTIEVEVS